MDLEEDFELVTHAEIIRNEGRTNLIETNTNSNYWNEKNRFKWKMILFFGCLLAYSSRTTMSICAVHVGKELGWDKKLSGAVLSSFYIGYIFTQIIGGVLADRLGGERMLYMSGGVWAISTLCIPFISKISFLPVTAGIILVQILAGAAQGTHFPALASLLSKRVAIENRNSIFSFAASGTAVGTITSGLFGSLLLDFSGWRSVFILTGGLSVTWVLVLGLFMSQESNDSGNKFASFDKATPIQWIKLLKIKAFWALMVTATCESLVFTNLLSWLPTYFHEQFPESQGWLFNVCPWIASFIIQNVCGILSDKMVIVGISRTSLRKLFSTAALIPAGIFCVILSFAKSYQLSLVLMTLIIGLLGCNSSGIGMNPQDLAPKHTGSLFGIMNTLGAISGMGGVYLTGHILHASNESWSSVFHMTSLTAIFGALVFLLFGSGKQII